MKSTWAVVVSTGCVLTLACVRFRALPWGSGRHSPQDGVDSDCSGLAACLLPLSPPAGFYFSNLNSAVQLSLQKTLLPLFSIWEDLKFDNIVPRKKEVCDFSLVKLMN